MLMMYLIFLKSKYELIESLLFRFLLKADPSYHGCFV